MSGKNRILCGTRETSSKLYTENTLSLSNLQERQSGGHRTSADVWFFFWVFFLYFQFWGENEQNYNHHSAGIRIKKDLREL